MQVARSSCLGIVAVLICRVAAWGREGAWEELPAVVQAIRTTEFPNRDFSIAEYGAHEGGAREGGAADCKPAIDAAIAECSAAGGGRVVVPRGEWLVNGPIHLRSNVNLHLASDATLKFSPEPRYYLPAVFTRFEGTELVNFSPLVYAIDQENVAITGAGTLDGQAGPKAWWPWKGKWGGEVDHGWQPGDPDQTAAVARLGKLADAGTSPTERRFGTDDYLRPSFVQFYRCRRVLIDGVRIINSPMWIVHPVLCESVIIRGVSVHSHGPNNDGCNPESCRNVLIEDCEFNTGDDCIAIKSGRNADGRRLNVPSENIVIRGCTMRDGHGGVTLGSEMSGGIRNVYVEDCEMSSPNLERAIRLKSNSLRGGFLENLFVRNIRVGEVSDAVIHIDLRYFDETGEHPPVVRNLHLDHITSEKSGRPLCFLGTARSPIRDVVIANCRFETAAEPSIIEHVESLQLLNVMQPE
ncbi:glycoside hydrolase family 28 protein [Lacipirellula parvula]|uniref:Polygalacturonase n=1 Tax=Lacipirellula parvula TaxID=2650471 RepID=A0A5K7XFL6_9BACT|nr:glycoside hydrolase family 28 protein [Lacipirellula parvula]BBO34837.1 polygalacturonase [Lacipirellula parvula]